ncbi:metal ABC transporter ATP-binding protein [Natranaerobius thermophilus]|uniref:ABC transporter related n=1 Tax=Natranaerobius thermophilus (strain ATCC BAA-1301 / DSM 18059 / JW/NM-WN-LF) TaxID=457570 RepID=B2A2Y4_NATTJ|nr:metal ABC transporter ATP-binding protein [Natranaerobius thermophilus]ACB86351.1 ABC transporter related [Natranaerobius thermophilus JW/NM-WN-LF]
MTVGKASQNGVAVQVENLSVSYHEVSALNKVSFSVQQGQKIGILGPNGAGKSSLIKAIMGLTNYHGKVKIFGKTVNESRSQIAYVPQQSNIDLTFPLSVEETVMMGRYPYLPKIKSPTKHDKEIVYHCIKQVGLTDKKTRQIGELSGGERQRMFLARALAQKARLFFLDEPFTGIDFTSEKMISNLLAELSEQGKTLFVVHHDLKRARQYFDYVILLNQNLIAAGKTEEVLQPHYLTEAYQGEAVIMQTDSEGGDQKNKDFLVVSG